MPPPSEEEQDTPLQAALVRLLDQLVNPGSMGVVVGLPPDHTLYRTLSIPFKEDKKIRQVLPFELEPSLPVAVESLVLDYLQTGDSDSHELLTVAMDRQKLDDVMADLAAVNLRPQLVVPGAFPLALALTTHSEQLEDQALLIEIGASKATLFALDNREIALIRSMPADITSENGVEALALNIRQTLTAFSDSKPQGFTAPVAYLSGPAFNDTKEQARLEAALEIETRLLDLGPNIPKLEMPGAIDDQWRPSVFNSALAVALIEAENRACPNFHRTSSVLRNIWTTYNAYIKGPVALLIAVIILSLGGVLIDSHMLKKRVDVLNAQMEEVFKTTFPNTPRVGDPVSQMQSELKKARGSGLEAGKPSVDMRIVDVLYNISKDLPKEIDVVFTRMVTGNDGLTISGEAAAFNVVDDIKKHLENDNYFKQVTIAAANMDKSGKKVSFKLKIEI